MSEFVVGTLDASTWSAYEALLTKHNGIWGGCWCMEFQRDRKEKYTCVEEKKCDKQNLVLQGKAKAALVFDGDLGTMAMFERRGFEKQRPVSMHNWVVTKQVEPRSKSA